MLSPSETCYTCLANSGIRPISPGAHIYEGVYWHVDHAYPTKLPGWLVLVLKRHATALHELSRDELLEVGELLARVTKLLHTELGCVKEYVTCYAESEHFKHVHIHVVPRTVDLPHELQGARSFALLNAAELVSAPAADIITLCERLREQFASSAENQC